MLISDAVFMFNTGYPCALVRFVRFGCMMFSVLLRDEEVLPFLGAFVFKKYCL